MKIAVAGAGIGGLATALLLSRSGRHDVQVFERAPELAEIGAGITLWPNAVRVLAAHGLGPTLRAAGHPAADGVIGTPSGRVLSHATSAPGEGGMLLGIHRADLQRILRAALPGDAVRLGAACAGFEQDPDGVSVRLDGDDDVRVDALIGADGIDSVVRRQLLGDGPPRYAGYTAYRAVLPDWAGRPDITGEIWGRGRRFGIVPIGQGRLYWFATDNQPAVQRLPAGHRKAHLVRLFEGWGFGIPDIIERTSADAVLQHDIVDRPPVRGWGRGRVVLLGDAAHPTTPNLGQGAAMAIEGAQVLQRALERVPVPSEAFAPFEHARAPRTAWVTRSSRRVGVIGQWSAPWAVGVRDLLVRATPGAAQRRATGRLSDYDATTAPL